MSGNVESFRIARIDNDVIDKQLGPIEVVQKVPVLAAVRRGVDLPVERSEIEPVGIAWIDDQTAHIASRRPVGAPVA